jgi:ABC-type branched-subunit amino acid transport system substrate-binding protein
VTADSIKVGITYVDLEAVKQFTDIDHGDYEASYRAIIDAVNANGGVLGRMIEPVFAPVDPVNPAANDESCVKLTEDNEVFAVIGFFQDDAVLCYVQDHEMAVLGGVMNAARLAAAKAPWFTLERNADTQNTIGLEALVADGTFEGSKVAVAVGPTDEALLDAALPALADAGVEVVSSAVLEDTGGDAAATEQNVKVIAEKFRSDGADVVLVAGSAFLPFANGLAKTDFRPRLASTDYSSAASFTFSEGADTSVLDGLSVAGVAPFTFDDPEFQACKATIEAAVPGLEIVDGSQDPGLPGDYVSANAACDFVGLFVTIATKAGADLTYDTFRAAGESLGAYARSGSPTVNEYSAEHPDGDPAVYVYHWDSGSSRLVAETDAVDVG